MKFYVISIILNIVILIIPVIQPIASEIKEEVLTVNLENIEVPESDNDVIGENNDMGGSGDDGGSSRKVEKHTAVQPVEISQSMQAKEKVIKNVNINSSDNLKKVTQAESDRGSNTSNNNINSGGKGDSAKQGGTDGGGIGSGNNKKSSSGGSGDSDKTDDSKKKSRSYGCAKGKGYKIISKSKIKRTKADELVIPDGTSVVVNLTFNLNGSVKVHGASGSNNSRAKDLAIQEAKKMKINVIDKEIVECKTTYTYNFI